MPRRTTIFAGLALLGLVSLAWAASVRQDDEYRLKIGQAQVTFMSTLGATLNAMSVDANNNLVIGNVNYPTVLSNGVVQVKNAGGVAELQWWNGAAGADLKRWGAYVGGDGSLHLRTINDAGTAVADAIAISNAGNAPSLIVLNADLLPRSLTVAQLSAIPCTTSLNGHRLQVIDAQAGTAYGATPAAHTSGNPTIVGVVCEGYAGTWIAG